MKIITGSSKVVQGTGDTKSATVSYEFGVKGSEQKRVRDRSIVQGTVPASKGISNWELPNCGGATGAMICLPLSSSLI